MFIVLTLTLLLLDRIILIMNKSNVEIIELRKTLTLTTEEIKQLRQSTVTVNTDSLERQLEKVDRDLKEVVKWAEENLSR